MNKPLNLANLSLENIFYGPYVAKTIMHLLEHDTTLRNCIVS